MGQKEAEQWAAAVDVQPPSTPKLLSSSGVAPNTMIVK
jgi:hypothetical protein